MTDVQTVTGIWADDTATYLADLKHPLMRQEWGAWMLARGQRPDSPQSLRVRRDFDRAMVVKYAEICPPPPRARWLLATYDIMDAQERRAAMPPRPVRKQEVTEYEEIPL